MKRPGFMTLETLISMGVMTFITLAALEIVTTNVTRINTLHERYEMLSTLKNHLTLKLLNPAQKEFPELIFERENVTVKTRIVDIAPKSSLKDFAHEMKLLHVMGYKDGSKKESARVVGCLITPPEQAPK